MLFSEVCAAHHVHPHQTLYFCKSVIYKFKFVVKKHYLFDFVKSRSQLLFECSPVLHADVSCVFQGDANRSYSDDDDDDEGSCSNGSEQHKSSLTFSGTITAHSLII